MAQFRYKLRSPKASNSGTHLIQGQVVQDAKPAPPLLLQEATTGTASASVIARGIDTTEIAIGIVREIAGGHARRLQQAGTTPT
eukprot:COSAG03_NODE_3312_length_2090_cov_1.318433_1_plen_83_part_10